MYLAYAFCRAMNYFVLKYVYPMIRRFGFYVVEGCFLVVIVFFGLRLYRF